MPDVPRRHAGPFGRDDKAAKPPGQSACGPADRGPSVHRCRPVLVAGAASPQLNRVVLPPMLHGSDYERDRGKAE